MNKKKISPFSKEFWMLKGMSEEQAEYKRNSIRPIRKEYWIEKGFSESEAIVKAAETKTNNNKKGAKGNSSRTKEEHYKTSPRRIEYWMEKGFSEEESKEKVKEIQSTFSLNSCVEKHGFKRGYELWLSRQLKWQKTLKSKSDAEISRINSSKNSIKLDLYSDVIECVSSLNKSRNMNLFSDLEKYEEYIKELISNKPYYRYYTLENFITHIPKVQIEIFESLNLDFKQVLEKFITGKEYYQYLITVGNKQSYRMRTEEGLLRSSYEIFFYESFKEAFPNENIMIDKNYPDSSFRYDFKVFDKYIEICPMIENDEKYKLKMQKKKELFDCVLLKNIEEIKTFINGL